MPVNKSLLNATGAAVRQLEPIKYDWAYEMYQQQVRNFWLPSEVSMADDIAHLRQMASHELDLIKKTLAFFACFEFEVANNLALNLYRWITVPEARMFLLAQGCIEAIHQEAYSLMVESLGVDKEYAYSGHETIESIKRKTEWADERMKEISDPSFTTDTLENKRRFLLNIVAFMLVEGLAFYGGFAALLSFKLRNRMPGMARQINYIMRDENLHCLFASKLAVSLCQEEPELWNTEVAASVQQMAMDVLRMEIGFVNDILPRGVPGMSGAALEGHLCYLAQKRVDPFGVQLQVQGKPMKWLSEIAETRQEANFFEQKVTEYAKGGLDWEEHGKGTLSWDDLSGDI